MTRRQRSIVTLASSIALAALAAPAFAQTAPAGWTPDWSDDFNGTSIDTNRWSVLTRQDSFNNEKEYYTPNAVTVSGGQLNITATNVPLGTKAYQSGLVQTKLQQTYGRWDIRASLPATQGMWPALWLLPQNVAWPTGGEIDFMENKGSTPGSIATSYHFGSSVATHQYVTSSFGYSVNGTPVSFQNSMHTYSVEWDPSRIRYLIDEVPAYTIYRNSAPISSTPMALIMNLAVGGDFGGDPNGSTKFPQTLGIDSVHVYDRDNTTRALSNGSFENLSGGLFQDWNEYSNGGGNVLVDSVASHAHTGLVAAQMYGMFNGATNASGLYQEEAAVPGEVFQVGAFSQNRPGDLLAGGNNARIKIDFIDQNGAVIGTSGILTTTTASSPAAYREGVLRRTAPANTKFARAVLEFQQINNATGAVDFDDASLKLYTSSAIAGDVNLDGSRDASDLDALNHSLTADNTAFDFNTDGSVNSLDVNSLLTSAFGTVRGDTNLNHVVDFDDLVTVAQNYGTLATGHWSIGDFNGDSNVDFDDLVVVAQNYGYGTGGKVSASDFASDWKLAQSLVPEPTTLIAGVSIVAATTKRRRKVVG